MKIFADKIPENARCNFENGWCGWANVPGRPLNWTLYKGATPSIRTGPSYDHTYRNETGARLTYKDRAKREARYMHNNMLLSSSLSYLTGTYAYVNMASKSQFIRYGSRGTLESPLYNPTPPYSSDPESPYHHSCQVCVCNFILLLYSILLIYTR